MPDTRYPGPESIHRQVLSNGMIVLVYENFAAASVVVEGYLRAGALGEGRAMAGLADFVASTLLHGTQHHSFSAIYEALESVGASLDFSAGRHVTDFSGSALAEDLDLVLDLLAGALRHPAFPAEEVEQVRGEIMTGLQIRANDTRQMASLRFRELLYADHPYGLSVYGYPETIAAITPEHLADFHRQQYGPQDMAIIIVGAVKPEDAVRRVEATLGDWRNDACLPSPDAPPASRPVVTIEDYVAIPNKTQSDLVLGLPGPRRSADDYLDLSLANTILGVFGMMGRLGATVREDQGLAYYIFSRLNGGLGPSPWYVATGVAPDRVDQARASILHEIARMQEELVPADELADNKTYRTGSLPVSLETNDGLASVIGDMELLDLGLDYLQRFPDLIEKITAEDVQAAAQKYWSTAQLAVAVAGPPPPAIFVPGEE
ncbi:MAG: pitrilysin family protein [Anaerolineae bacterium]|nr:pitrilysin family protein [Anaerolineae bacterium]